MSLFNNEDDMSFRSKGAPCFLCGEPTEGAGVMWSGDPSGGGMIFMHAPCAQQLALALGRDVLEYTMTYGQRVWAEHKVEPSLPLLTAALQHYGPLIVARARKLTKAMHE